MSDTERLRDELALAEATDALESAREKMHAANTPETVAAYRDESAKVVELRQAFRTKYPRQQQSGVDGVATPDTVKATGKAEGPR